MVDPFAELGEVVDATGVLSNKLDALGQTRPQTTVDAGG